MLEGEKSKWIRRVAQPVECDDCGGVAAYKMGTRARCLVCARDFIREHRIQIPVSLVHDLIGGE